MAERGGIGKRLRRYFVAASGKAGSAAARRLATGRMAIVEVERAACEAIVFGGAEGACRPERETRNVYGRRVSEVAVASARAAVDRATGFALSGRRAAVFLPVDGLAEVRPALAEAVRRRIPLVVHAPLARGHSAYHGAAETGCGLMMARNASHAASLALAARRASEEALLPFVVASDAAGTYRAVHEVVRLDAQVVRDLLGDAGDSVPAPSPGQKLVFGESRRRVPRYFDLDRPLAIARPPEGAAAGAAAATRELVFAEPAARLVRESLDAAAQRTGEPLSMLAGYAVGRGRALIAAQGDLVELAEAAIERLRADRRSGVDVSDVEVVGIDCLRPLARDELRALMREAKRLIVLERADAADLEGPPLARELRSVIGADGPAITSAICGVRGAPVGHRQIAAALVTATRGDEVPPSVYLDLEPASGGSELPRREALLQQVARELPGADRLAGAAPPPAGARGSGMRTLSIAAGGERADEMLVDIAGRCRRERAVHVVSRVRPEGIAGVRVLLAFADARLRAVADDEPADVLVAAVDDAAPNASLLESVRPGGTLVLAFADACGAPQAPSLPPAWRETVRRRELRVVTATGGPSEWIESASAALWGAPIEGEALQAPETFAAESDEISARVSRVVERLARAGGAAGSLSRFWGESQQPRLAGGRGSRAVDPHLAIDATPVASASLHARHAVAPRAPVIDPAKCTACAACWTYCPDSAVAALALPTGQVVESLAKAVAGPAAAPARAARTVSAVVESRIAAEQSRSLTPGTLADAAARIIDKTDPGQQERDELLALVDAASGALEAVSVAATDTLFHDAQRASRGSGRLLALAIDPLACQACGLCAAVCEDDAVSIEPLSDEQRARQARAWSLLEKLPDTDGQTIARLSASTPPGSVGALLLSRHTAAAVSGADRSEPGSGERIALRLVAAIAEHELQLRQIERLETIDALRERVRGAIRASIEDALPLEDMDALAKALEDEGPRPAANESDAPTLDLSSSSALDRARLGELARASKPLDELAGTIESGPHGMGRCRFGLVVAGAAAWATEFGRSPFQVPLLAALGGEGCEQAIGLARTLRDDYLEEVRAVRRVRVLLDPPQDRQAASAEIEDLDWSRLTPEERAGCPPLLVLADVAAMDEGRHAALTGLLASRLPLKLVLLDERDIVRRAEDPTLLALAMREAFVVAGSIAHPEHLVRGLKRALAFDGPAIVHLHAPSPRRDGFATEDTLLRARLAVECRVHPLVVYDPAARGLFGERLELADNPRAGERWGRSDGDASADAAEWALGEGRYSDFVQPAAEDGMPLDAWLELGRAERAQRRVASRGADGVRALLGDELAAAVARRAEIWGTLQELGGLATPFTERLRGELRDELERERDSALAQLREEHHREAAGLRDQQRQDDVVRLRDRLLQLAGYAAPAGRTAGEPPGA